MRAKRTAICEHCGTEFTIKQSTKANRYCSHACYHAAMRRPVRDRFLEKVAMRGPDECWEWQGERLPSGYGRMSLGSKQDGRELAHRPAYMFAYGPIPDGLFVLHDCDNPPCCNPTHLFSGTHTDNMRDKIAKGRANNQTTRKLSDADILSIRERWSTGGVTQPELAAEYGVSQSLIHLVVSRKHRTSVV